MKKAVYTILLVVMVMLFASCSLSTQSKPDWEKKPNDSAKLPYVNNQPQVQSQPQQEPVTVVNVTGFGDMKENAVTDARLKALQQVVGLQISSQSKVSNFTLLDKSVYTRTKGYIKSEKEVKDYGMDNGFYKVEMRFEVSQKMPDDDFYFVVKQMNKPKIGIWLPAVMYRGNLSAEDRSAEIALIDKLKEFGFDVYDTERLSELTKIRQDVTNVDYKSFRKYGVDVLITGGLYGESSGQISGLETARAKVDLKTYWTQTGQLIAATSYEKGAPDISVAIAVKKAVKEAANAAGTDLAKKIVKEWMDQVANGLPLELYIANIDTDTYMEFVAYLRNNSNIAGVDSPVFESNTLDVVTSTYLQPDTFYIKVLKPYFASKNITMKLENQSKTQMVITLNK